MSFSRPLVALIATLLGACENAGDHRPISTPTADLANLKQTQVARGLSFVEAQCSGCHAVRPGIEPPNPQAPSFVAVANDMGFKQSTLRSFFRDGHETPDAMSIKLDDDEAEIAAAYIMSLRSHR